LSDPRTCLGVVEIYKLSIYYGPYKDPQDMNSLFSKENKLQGKLPMKGGQNVVEEQVLLKKSQEGDIAAFEKLIEGYQKRVFNIAYRLVGNYDDASELAQEVFIKVFKSLRKFKGQSSFSTWVYSITKNVCFDELRKRKNKKIVYIDEDIKYDNNEMQRQIEDDRPQPDIIAEKNEVKKIVHEAIQELSQDHRIVIVMRDIQGFSYEEIARILNCPEGTVKSRINRARLSLKQILQKNEELLKGYYVK
jgi:RNA polymerase sigma-70 factor (ECF subfamily)